jgi:hypothetical protein
MSSFHLILKKILDLENYIFSTSDKNNKINPYQQLIFNSMISFLRFNGNKTKYKFIFLNNCLNNMFYGDDIKKQFLEYFCQIQRTYYAFNRLAYLYKFKSSKIVVNKDMALNEINLNDKNIICIYQLNYKYLFNVKDILKVIQSSLTNSNMFFLDPITIKNPYNNVPFNKSTLCNIYFFIKFNTNIYCDLFFKFFNENFNLKIFFRKYEYILREISVENFVNNSPSKVLHKETIKMIDNYNSYVSDKRKIIIDKDFPEKKLIKIMKPYLLLYYKGQYSLIEHIKFTSSNILNNKLHNFQKYNPVFGRKIAVLKKMATPNFKRRVFIKNYTFNDKHILFNKNNNTHFLLDHMSNTFDDDSSENENNEEHNEEPTEDPYEDPFEENIRETNNDNNNNYNYNYNYNIQNENDDSSSVSSEENFIIENSMGLTSIDSDNEGDM